MRLLLAMLGASVGLAGAAHGDPDPDTTFLTTLAAAGITYAQPDRAIAAARVVCRSLGEGMSATDVANILQSNNPGLTPERSAQFMGIAAQSYCPDKLTP